MQVKVHSDYHIHKYTRPRYGVPRDVIQGENKMTTKQEDDAIALLGLYFSPFWCVYLGRIPNLRGRNIPGREILCCVQDEA